MKEGRYQIEEKYQQINMNYFRESFISNKQTEKDSNFLSLRLKEDLTKGKPRLLTSKLPEAFKVKEQNKQKEVKMSYKQTSNDVLQSKENNNYSTETNSQNVQKSYQQNQKQNSSSDNSDSDKTPRAKDLNKEGTFSTRTRAESDETDNDRNMFKKPMFIKGISFNSSKAQTIDSKIKSSQEFNKENIFIRQAGNNTIGNYKTHTSFPKFTMDNISNRNNTDQYSNANNIMMFNKNFALEDGFSYFINNSKYKYYFHVPTIDIYFLKEIEYDSKVIEDIKHWKQKNDFNVSFIKVYQYFINNPEGCISIIMEHPYGFNLFDMINSTGVANNYLLRKIAKNSLSFLSEYNKANKNEDYGLFCLCDLFYDINGNMKVIPNLFKHNQNSTNSLCECKKFITEIAKILKIPITQYLSLGVILLKCAIGNIPLKCFDLIFCNKQIPNKCCLLHILLSIEKIKTNPKDTLLLSNFLRLLPEKFTQLLCKLLSIDASNQMASITNGYLSQIEIRPNVSLHMKELLNLVNVSSSSYTEPHLHKFITNFDIVFSHLKDANDKPKNSQVFLSNFKNKLNIINSICQIFDLEPDNLISKLYINIKEA